MNILHIALGGCLDAPPIRYGKTSDTGGHIAYILGAADAQAAQSNVGKVIIATRRFNDETLGAQHNRVIQQVSEKIVILRLGHANQPYLDKEALNTEIDTLSDSLFELNARVDLKIDAVHAHFSDAAIIGLRFAERMKAPLVFTPHSLGMDKEPADKTASLTHVRRIKREKLVLSSADGIIASTHDEIVNQIGQYGAPNDLQRCRVIRPGVPRLPTVSHDHGRRFLTSHLRYPDRPMILAIARPVIRKNLEHLARVYAAHSELQRSANLVILAGQHANLPPKGEEARVISSLNNIRRQANLTDCFALPPAHNSEDCAGLYLHAARVRGVFVNPALHEPFGLTLLEAASSGLPVIATRNGGPAEILDHGKYGILVDPNSARELSDAISSLLNSRSMWDAYSSAVQACAKKWCWKSFARESIAFYQHLAQKRTFPTTPNRASISKRNPLQEAVNL